MVIFNKDLNADKVVHSCNLQFNLFHSIGPETARNERYYYKNNYRLIIITLIVCNQC